MRADERVPPTRVELIRARRELTRVRRGTALLRRKREALVGELFRLARPAVDAREAIAARVDEAAPVLLRALVDHGGAGTRALGWPAREIAVELQPGMVWGTPIADIVARPPLRRTLDARALAPASAGPAAIEAAERFEAIAELLLDAAAREGRLRRLGEALARTSRHLSTLEQRLAPSLESRIALVRRTLEEREREEHLRLKHVQRKKE